MKKLIFICFLFFSVYSFSQGKVELDSLMSKAFRFEYLECELVRKDLKSTEKLLVKEEKTTAAFEKIIAMQEEEQLEALAIIAKERTLKENANKEIANLNTIIKKKKTKNTWEKIGIGVLASLGGYGLGKIF